MRIFVGNLAWSTTEDELHQLFEPYGEIERTQIITDRETGRSRGFGFVEMPNLTALVPFDVRLSRAILLDVAVV